MRDQIELFIVMLAMGLMLSFMFYIGLSFSAPNSTDNNEPSIWIFIVAGIATGIFLYFIAKDKI